MFPSGNGGGRAAGFPSPFNEEPGLLSLKRRALGECHFKKNAEAIFPLTTLHLTWIMEPQMTFLIASPILKMR